MRGAKTAVLVAEMTTLLLGRAFDFLEVAFVVVLLEEPWLQFLSRSLYFDVLLVPLGPTGSARALFNS